MKTKVVIFLILLFAIFNISVYFVTERNAKQRVNLTLEANLKTLQTHYEILLHTQKVIASTMYKSTIFNDRVLEIISQAQNSTKEKRKILRDELYTILAPRYERAKEKGVLQYQFVFLNNVSFLRMHKPSRFDDDLTDVRDDFRYTNENHKAIRVFSQGRTSHGFRNTFPLFNKDSKYIGAMEVSFSSDNFQWFLNNISHIHTHFLVDKNIFDAKAWERDDLILNYFQSAEHLDCMIAFKDDMHTKQICITKNLQKLKPIRDKIYAKMSHGNPFTSFVKHNQHVDTVAFLPIRDLQDRTIAWLVSYEESEFIELTLKNLLVMRIVAFVFSVILIYFIALEFHSKVQIESLLRLTEKKAYIDGLTRVYNRNKFDEIFDEEMKRVQRYQHPLSMAILDIDKFKNFNDKYGHLIGDEILIMIAQNVNKNVRKTDTFARWGGEEFVILFKETTSAEANIISKKLKNSIEELKHPTANRVTVSFGITQFVDGDTIESMFKRCDKALYLAKGNGRNRIEIL